ncbi:hypothetical protein B9Z19DRAFT_1073460 [Tuber borchii]|uniref:Uncharacterized protein n=1 Tax=Tuber borchii TaxID=42251 RepID=A0A2T7A5Y7_TUBBO|nr:hypothetical protein B9Z19DRAFT_1073460 [Tuber borchii]
MIDSRLILILILQKRFLWLLYADTAVGTYVCAYTVTHLDKALFIDRGIRPPVEKAFFESKFRVDLYAKGVIHTKILQLEKLA